jgi:hypothetical protein
VPGELDRLGDARRARADEDRHGAGDLVDDEVGQREPLLRVSLSTSPASPKATIPCAPASSAKRTTCRWASASTASSAAANGVQMAGKIPRQEPGEVAVIPPASKVRC